MFYKDRLKDMLQVYKYHMNIACDRWNAEIAEKGSVRINAMVEFERIHSHFMNHICFGIDVNDELFDFNVLDEKAKTWSVQKCSMREAVNNMFTQAMELFLARMSHPILGPMNFLLGTKFEAGQMCRNIRAN